MEQVPNSTAAKRVFNTTQKQPKNSGIGTATARTEGNRPNFSGKPEKYTGPSSCSGQNPQEPEGLESKSQYTRSMPSCVSKTDIKTTFSAIVLFSHLLGLGHLGQDTCECHFVGCHAVSTHELQQLRSHDPPPRLRGSVYKVRHEPDVCRDTHGSRLEPSTSVGQTDR